MEPSKLDPWSKTRKQPWGPCEMDMNVSLAPWKPSTTIPHLPYHA
uniref:Uncharacterized protein n=1 Tax=Rhizophora mucronata TaxID=61149 RepID=A0A2P2NJG2_RHIMU